MSTIIRVKKSRLPEFSLGVDAQDKGWSLLHSKENAAILTESPAGLLFSPDQFEKMGLKEWPHKCGGFESKFDELYETIESACDVKDIHAINRAATSFLNKNTLTPLSKLPKTDRRVYDFFTFKSSSTKTEKAQFLKSFKQEELSEYFSTARQKLDTLKTVALAKQAIGTLASSKDNEMARLYAQLAFSILANPLPKKGKKSPILPVKLVDRVLDMHAFFPGFIFDINPCMWSKAKQRISPLLEKHQKIEATHAKIQVKTATHSETHTGEDASGATRPETGCNSPNEPCCEDAVSDGNCECECNDPCLPTDPCCGEVNYYISDVLEFRDKIECYEVDELAYLENVIPLEKRVRKHGFVKTVDIFTEDETTTSRSEERNHQVTNKNSLQTAIETQFAASLDVDAKIEGVTPYGQSYEVNTSASVSREVSQREARESLKEIVTNATMKLQSETRKLRSRRVITEMTESNKHVLKGGNLPKSHPFYWVKKKMSAQVYSHGVSLLVDINIPFPAARYIELMKRKEESSFNLEKPKKPCLKISDISPSDYHKYLEEYGVRGISKPPKTPPAKHTDVEGTKGDSATVTIPAGYSASKMTMIQHDLKVWSGNNFGRITFSFAGGKVERTHKGTDTATNTINTASSGAGSFHGNNNAKGKSYLKVRITLTPDPVDISEWQLEVYSAIIDKYEAELLKYNDALDEHKFRQKESREGMNPFIAQKHMETQLKQSAIFMMCGEHPSDGVMNMNAEPCGYPEINRPAANIATNWWSFFDKAFNWKRAEYVFYDYSNTPMCRWHETFDPDEPNFLKKEFLSAGYARCVVPAFPAMQLDVLKFIQDGEIWGGDGKPPFDPNDIRFTSVIEEIKHSYDCYQNDREGIIEAKDGVLSGKVLLKETDRYWDPTALPTPGIDQNQINLDLDREIFIDGEVYKIIDISLDPLSPPYDPADDPSKMQWIICLERTFEGDASQEYKHAIGAKAIGAPLSYSLPTELVYLGDLGENNCLPCYPVLCGE